MKTFSAVAELESIPPDTSRVVRFKDRFVALFNRNGAIHALDNECPHKGAPLGGGTVEGGTVFCPFHGWEFDLTTGVCRTNPERLATVYPVKIIDGTIHLSNPTE